MQMPAEEVGKIKEGPAKRYLDGQALWEKKFRRAIKRVAKHRKRNIRHAREKDSSKIAKMWQQKVGEHRMREAEQQKGRDREESEAEHSEMPSEVDPDDSSDSSDGEDYEARGNSAAERKGDQTGAAPTRAQSETDDRPRDNDVLDQTWSWRWAMEGERPPPSAIVSRRDFGEARQLALMADRMDSTHETPVHGLSIWVGLAAFFSSSSERSRAQEAVKQAKAVKRTEHERRREERRAHRELETQAGHVGSTPGRKLGQKLGDMLHISWGKDKAEPKEPEA